MGKAPKFTTGEEILANHPAYENDDRLGNRWFQGRYRPGIREFGYPVRLPQEQWGPLAKMRDGFDERSSNQLYRWTRNKPDEQTKQRSSRDDRTPQDGDNAQERNVYGSNVPSTFR